MVKQTFLQRSLLIRWLFGKVRGQRYNLAGEYLQPIRASACEQILANNMRMTRNWWINDGPRKRNVPPANIQFQRKIFSAVCPRLVLICKCVGCLSISKECVFFSIDDAKANYVFILHSPFLCFFTFLTLAITSSTRSVNVHVSISESFPLALAMWVCVCFFYFLLRYRYVYLFIRTNKIIENENETNDRGNQWQRTHTHNTHPHAHKRRATSNEQPRIEGRLTSNGWQYVLRLCLDKAPFRCA